MLHFNYFKKALVSLAILGMSINIQMPVKAQNVVTQQQLDQLSLEELDILRAEQLRQANIVIDNCYNSSYINPNSCDIMDLQYMQYFENLNNYIAQRQELGS